MKKVILIILLLVVIIITGLAAYVKFALPNVGPAPDLKIVSTPERVVHGEYLANHVAVCMDCHSTRDWSHFSGPLEAGTLGKGGEYFSEKQGFPGKFYSKNITPANIKDWTDGEIFRMITTGVDKYGNAMFPVMPYSHYGKMDKEDIYDIIAYIRSLPPIENKTPDHEVDFPMNFILNTIPAKASFVQKPSKSDSVKYGAYLVNAAACMECHTQVKRGQIIPDLAFGGGREFEMPNGIVRSANITPDMVTGIGSWTESAFLARFDAYKDTANLPLLAPDKVNTVMPWAMYTGMDSSDLKSIYAYLRTVKPIKNMVVHFALKNEKK
ncbi:MAG: cytochrome C [Bacteroidota bacterium]|nr:cytochrome C [Bacteroidota bacterium]